MSMADSSPPYCLRELHGLTRLAITLAVLIMLGGLGVSGLHLRGHYDNRDGTPGLTLDDIRGAYHGVQTTAALITVLREGHAGAAADADLADGDREILLTWLEGDRNRISGDFDNLDLGDAAPAEVLAVNCLQCHARNASAGGGIGDVVPLEYWDDVEKVAFGKDVQPTNEAVMIASLHTHALSMGMILICTILLAMGTRWRRGLTGLILCVAAFGLAMDLVSWPLARGNDLFVFTIVGGGMLFAMGTGLSLLSVVVDLWLPRTRNS